MPEDPVLQTAAVQTGLLGPGMVGLTLGYTVFICRSYQTVRLLSHECRHVYQDEQAGSIAAFLPGYLQQIVQFNGEKATRLSWMHHGIAHEEYHRGQIALYARLAGEVPALTKLIMG